MPARCDDTPCCRVSWRAHADAHSCVLCVLMFGFIGYVMVGERVAVVAVLVFVLILELLLSVALFVAFCALPPALTITTVVEEPVVQVV